ncbi:(Fe-S)-binding protein [Metabacillus iocasae]|uniref:Glycolate oxidase iron-sulfur subunit n=1 Tax=Priestia iocasae TaxID=2291674 RepID=A0ABS2QW78_9BACI|nr:(Fe-S)-binding protein [Metabacillus iocasae]MBM7703006.1 glycolate oxidase iron-sulfur subunit [Metabacillus iocasae]
MTNLAYEETFDCVQCGYCLPVCPTYLTTGKEAQSPRGRIHLVKMAAEGRISYDTMNESMALCLGCRACETACPTNVQYGDIYDSAIRAVHEKTPLLKRLLLKNGLTNKTILTTASYSLQLYQTLKIDKVVRQSGILNALPPAVKELERVTPPVKAKKHSNSLHPSKKPRYKVAFFVGCIMDVMFAQINELSMKLLQLGGCEVVVIKEQTCCGALQHHSGEHETAKQLAKANIEAFEKVECDYIVNSIGGCGAMLVEYDKLFKDETMNDRAKAFTSKCVDISVLLAQLNLPMDYSVNKTVTYQPSCHLRNVQRVEKEPMLLLQQIKGLTYVELAEKDVCCGSAGIYNIEHYDEAMSILDRKMNHAKSIEPDVIVTSNPGCHLQMKLGVKRACMSEQTNVVHLVELVAEACGIGVKEHV